VKKMGATYPLTSEALTYEKSGEWAGIALPWAQPWGRSAEHLGVLVKLGLGFKFFFFFKEKILFKLNKSQFTFYYCQVLAILNNASDKRPLPSWQDGSHPQPPCTLFTNVRAARRMANEGRGLAGASFSPNLMPLLPALEPSGSHLLALLSQDRQMFLPLYLDFVWGENPAPLRTALGNGGEECIWDTPFWVKSEAQLAGDSAQC
jgi:hypothetical protein